MVSLSHIFKLAARQIIYLQIFYYNQVYMQKSKANQFKPAHLYESWQQEIIPLLKNLKAKAIHPSDILRYLSKIHDLNRNVYKSSFFKNSDKESYSLEQLTIFKAQDLIDLLSNLASFLITFRPDQPIELLRIGKRGNGVYEKKTIFYLVVLMFFGLVPKHNKYQEQEFKRFNNMRSFAHILSHSVFKTQCLIVYLDQTLKQIRQQKQPVSYIVQRNLVKQSVAQLVNAYRHRKLVPIQILQNSASIQDFNGKVKVDFANRFIGGGCLRNGCVQQEIMFAVRPQLYALTLLCQEMESDEAIAFTGFRRRFISDGYGDKTTFRDKCKDKYAQQTSQKGIIYDEYIVAIDATKYNKFDSKQFTRHSIDRQIKKAVAGFSMYEKTTIVSGGWGCGVYNGDFQTKLIIQWIAATISGNQLYICPFGRKRQIERTNLLQKLKRFQLGDLYDLLLYAAEKRGVIRDTSLFEIMLDRINR